MKKENPKQETTRIKFIMAETPKYNEELLQNVSSNRQTI